MTPAKENMEPESGRETLIAEETTGKIRNFSAIFALLCCGASLYTRQAHLAVFCFGVFLVLRLNKLPPFLEKHGVKIFTVISALIFCFGIATRILMFARCRTLWWDEACFAENIVTRDWSELLATPLINLQSAPALYTVAVKAICSVFGYSEFSLRLFSLLSFIGLSVCEWIFLKKVLNIDDIKTAFALIITAVVPSFVYYSNELKPYMGDAFFVVLALLLYAFYTQNKVSLIKLTVFYVLILGFCSPALFFIGGILTTEFLTAAFARDKKRVLYVSISGLSVVALFGLYYYRWLLPQMTAMDAAWNRSYDKSGFDAFFIVLVISLYFLYTLHSQKKPSLIILTLLYTLISVFCPPAVFFAGGILAGELFTAVFAGNKRQTVLILASILSIAAVFGMYYILRTSSVSEALNDFWNNANGKASLINAVKNIFVTVHFVDSKLVWALVPFALLGIRSLIKQRNKVAYSVVLSVFFVCLASSMGKWPLSGRLWLFLPAVVTVFSSVGLDLISKGGNIVIRRTVFCLFFAVTVYYTLYWLNNWPSGGGMVLEEEGVRINQSLRFRNMRVYTLEVYPLIQYVKENIKDDETLYVYPLAVPTLKFKNGYNNHRIGQTDRDNIIYGVNENEWNENKLGAELDAVIGSRKAYLLFQHYWRGIEPGLTVLQKYGTVSLVMVNYDTPLLYFEAYE